MFHRSFDKAGLFLRFSPGALFCYSSSFLIVWCLCGLVLYFRQQSVPTSRGAPNTAAPVSVGNPRSLETVENTAARPREVVTLPAAIQLPPYTQTFDDSIDSDFYQTIIRNNLFSPLGTVLNAEPEPGRHLTLVGTFLAEDPEASSVLVKNTTTGRHHLLSVGEGVGDFHVLAVEPKQVRFYHHGTEVKLHLSESETLFLNTSRR